MNIFQLLEYEEGYKPKAYLCSEGYPTIGIGKKIGSKGVDPELYEFTCPKSVAYEWLKVDIAELRAELDTFEWFTELNPDRKAIIISMAYQMGLNGLLGFSNMIRALEFKQWEQAFVEALDSRWSNQTPARANRHAQVLRCGDLTEVYGE